MNDVLFTFIVPELLKDDVVDVLTTQDYISGFNLIGMNGYSQQHRHFSVREQVLGFRELNKFEVIIDMAQKALLIEALREVCGPAKLRYWLAPILETGHWE